MKSRICLFLCVSIFILLVTFNWRDINAFFAHRSIAWVDNVIDSQKTVTFRSTWVDSLYVKKSYAYYLFMKEGPESDNKVIRKLPYDSMLTIKPFESSHTFVEEHPDTISLPTSVLDLMVKKGKTMALYQILSAKKDTIGYLYKLKRIDVQD